RRAESLREAVRAVHLPCRIGGDEFAVILPESGVNDAKQLYDRVQERLKDGAPPPTGQALRFSAGIAQLEHGDTSATPFERAGAAPLPAQGLRKGPARRRPGRGRSRGITPGGRRGRRTAGTQRRGVGAGEPVARSSVTATWAPRSTRPRSHTTCSPPVKRAAGTGRAPGEIIHASYARPAGAGPRSRTAISPRPWSSSTSTRRPTDPASGRRSLCGDARRDTARLRGVAGWARDDWTRADWTRTG